MGRELAGLLRVVAGRLCRELGSSHAAWPRHGRQAGLDRLRQGRTFSSQTYPGMKMLGLFVALALLLVAAIPVRAQSRPKAPPADMVASPSHPGWSVDRRTGCWVWDDTPQPKDRVT